MQWTTVTSKQLVHMRKYIQGHDHLGPEETAVEVLFGFPLWDGWSHLGFHLNSNNGKKKDLCNLCIDGLLFDLIEIRALFNKSFVFVSNQETSATSSDVGSKVIKS